MPYQWNLRTNKRPEEYHLIPTYQGDTYLGFLVTVHRTDSQGNSTPWPLADVADVVFTLRSNKVQGQVLYSAKLGAGITLVDAPQGKMSIDPFLCNFPGGTHHYDLRLKDDQDRVLTLLVGTLIIYLSRAELPVL